MKKRDLTTATDVVNIPLSMNLSPAIQIKAAPKVFFSLISSNFITLLLTSQRLMELKTSNIFSINWGNMPEYRWENNCRKPQCYFCSHFSWLMQHFHSHMLLTVSLVSKFQNLFFPASQLVIWRAGKRKSRRTSTAAQHQGWLLHDQREWN